MWCAAIIWVCVCFWIPTIWFHLGSVLRLLQLHWPKQSSPSDQRHRWDWAVVAEPSSLQGTGLQWGECYLGPWTGEIIIPSSALNSCLLAATCWVDNDCSVVTVKYIPGCTRGKRRNVFSVFALVLLLWDELFSFTCGGIISSAFYFGGAWEKLDDFSFTNILSSSRSDHVNNDLQLHACQESESCSLASEYAAILATCVSGRSLA